MVLLCTSDFEFPSLDKYGHRLPSKIFNIFAFASKLVPNFSTCISLDDQMWLFENNLVRQQIWPIAAIFDFHCNFISYKKTTEELNRNLSHIIRPPDKIE